LRVHFIVLMALMTVAAQGCATRDPATRVAEDAAADDETCLKRGAPNSEAYEACRKSIAEARAQAAAVQEQKRRDFDRTLGAGTEGQNAY
jgi:hypothetical protein